VSRVLFIVVIAGALAVGAFTVFWIVMSPVGMPAASNTPFKEDSREQAHDFLGGDPDRNVRGGQEMKPRW
jgi:Ti type entry exclusion protein TrbK